MVIADKRRGNDKIRKELHNLFKKFGFIIEIDMNLKVVQYLGVKLNLHTGNVFPYIKPNSKLKYLNTSQEAFNTGYPGILQVKIFLKKKESM